MNRYVVIVEETTIHRVEVEAANAPAASKTAVDCWRQGSIVDPDPYLDQLNVLEVRKESDDV